MTIKGALVQNVTPPTSRPVRNHNTFSSTKLLSYVLIQIYKPIQYAYGGVQQEVHTIFHYVFHK